MDKQQRHSHEAGQRIEARMAQYRDAEEPPGRDRERPGQQTRNGALPNFIIIGAQKCGTGFLYRRLRQHPEFRPTNVREVHYFDDNFYEGLDWYRSHFPVSRGKGERWTVTGEKSPYYLYHPHAAKRIAKVVPQVKLIVLLRNPVDRAYSAYHHQRRAETETLSFEDAIAAEEHRLRGEEKKMLADERYVSFNHRRFSYLSRGVYVDQLRNWHDYFEREQMLILKSEDFYSRTQENMALVLDFLSLPIWRFDLSEPKNKGRYEPMGPATRQSLKEYFEPHNRRLYEYLGADLGW